MLPFLVITSGIISPAPKSLCLFPYVYRHRRTPGCVCLENPYAVISPSWLLCPWCFPQHPICAHPWWCVSSGQNVISSSFSEYLAQRFLQCLTQNICTHCLLHKNQNFLPVLLKSFWTFSFYTFWKVGSFSGQLIAFYKLNSPKIRKQISTQAPPPMNLLSVFAPFPA